MFCFDFAKLSKLLPLTALAFVMACSDGHNHDHNHSQPQAVSTDSSQTTSAPNASKSDHLEEYVVMSQPSYPPFASRDDKGNIVGLDIDLLQAIGEREGIKFVFLPHDMTGILETLNKGDADIVATGVNITPERQEIYDFSEPYLESSWVALIDGNRNNFATFEELHDKKIATQQDSLSETQLKRSKITQDIMLTKTVYLGVTAISQGKADAVYDVDSVLSNYITPDNKYYMLLDKNAEKAPFGFVLKKGNHELKAILDKGLQDIKADGTYQKILEKWYPQANIANTERKH